MPYSNMDTEDDYALAMQLMVQYEEEINEECNSGKNNFHDQGKIDDFCKKIDEDLDYAFALQLQSYFEEEETAKSHTCFNTIVPTGKLNNIDNKIAHNKYVRTKNSAAPTSIVDKIWEIHDPNPDIHSLFLQFNSDYFWRKLNGIEVKWSSRMTLCAGVCSYEGYGGLCSIRISQPLLKFRPRRDLVETLLHEMIHAYLFVTNNNKDHDAHGPEFLKHMNRINQLTGANISVYHSFHDEVDIHRKHWWKCNGPCQKRPPFYGMVKRAMNRAPAPHDPWWADHQAKCGGTFIKVKEPELNVQKKNSKRKCAPDAVKNSQNDASDIRSFFSENSSSATGKEKLNNKGLNNGQISERTQPSNIHTVSSPKRGKHIVIPFSGPGHLLGTSTDEGRSSKTSETCKSSPSTSKAFPGEKFKLSGSVADGSQQPSVGFTNLPTSSMKTRVNNNIPVSKKVGGSFRGNHKTVSSSGITSGGFTKVSTSVGSKTIVIKKPTKELAGKTPNHNKNKIGAFHGKGNLLGSVSSAENSKNINRRNDSPTRSTSSANNEQSQMTLNNFFSKSPSTSRKIKSEQEHLRKVCDIFNSDSDEDYNSQQLLSNDVRVQESARDDIVYVEHSDTNRQMIPNGSEDLKCPVCGKMVKETMINSHLDMCLQPL